MLRSLGYTAGDRRARGRSTTARCPIPRTHVHLYERLQKAMTARRAGAPRRRSREIEDVAARGPRQPVRALRAGRPGLSRRPAGARRRRLRARASSSTPTGPACGCPTASCCATCSRLDGLRAAAPHRGRADDTGRPAHARSAWRRRCTARGQTAEAETLLAGVLARAPGHVEALAAQGRLLVAQGRPAEAVPLLERAAAAGADPEPWVELARVHIAQGDGPAASRAAARALAVSPRHPWAMAIAGARAAAGRPPRGRTRAAAARAGGAPPPAGGVAEPGHARSTPPATAPARSPAAARPPRSAGPERATIALSCPRGPTPHRRARGGGRRRRHVRPRCASRRAGPERPGDRRRPRRRRLAAPRRLPGARGDAGARRAWCARAGPGVLRSIVPPLSPLVWTTIATGVSPLQHRILDFTRFDPQTGAREPITSDERRAKAVWEMAGESGRDVAVFGLWATHPAEPVRGLMVSDRLFSFQRAATAGAARCRPSRRPRRPRARGAARGGGRRSALAALQAYLPWLGDGRVRWSGSRGPNPYAHPVTALRRILVETRLYHRLAARLDRAQAPGAVLRLPPGHGHRSATCSRRTRRRASPRSTRPTSSATAGAGDVLPGGRRLLGEYRALAERTGAALLVVSDHGFLWGEGRPRAPTAWPPRPPASGTATRASTCCGARASRPRRRGARVASARSRPRSSRCSACRGPPASRARRWPVWPRARRCATTGRAPSPPRAAPADPAAREAIDRLRALGYVGRRRVRRRGRPRAASTRTAGSFVNEGLLLVEADRLAEAPRGVRAGAAHRSAPGLGRAQPQRPDRVVRPRARRRAAARRARRRPGRRAADRGAAGRRLQAGRATAPRAAAARRRRRRAPGDARLRLTAARSGSRRASAPARSRTSTRHGAPPRDSPCAHGLAGTALLCLGRMTEGRAALERSLALDPSQSRLRQALAGLR